jgi:hypothetical protein
MCCHVVTNTGSSEADFGISPTDLTCYEPVLVTVHAHVHSHGWLSAVFFPVMIPLLLS